MLFRSVGFELYCRILQDAIDEIKGVQPPPKSSDIHIEIPLEAFIPTDYIPDGSSRVSLYQDLSSITDIELIPEFEEGIVDRYGPFPKPVVSLINIIKIKILAGSLGIQKIILSKNAKMTIYFEGNDDYLKKIMTLFIQNSKYQIQIDYSPPVSLNTNLISRNTQTQCLEIVDILNSINKKIIL